MLKKLYNFAKRQDKRLKFIFVGGLNTLIGYGVNALILLIVFKIPFNFISKATEIQALIAAVCGHAAGMVNSFFWNKYFTFENKGKSFLQVLRFFAVSMIQLALNYGLLIFLQNVIGLGIYLAQIITLVITTLFSYIAHNYYTFGKKIPDKH